MYLTPEHIQFVSEHADTLNKEKQSSEGSVVLHFSSVLQKQCQSFRSGKTEELRDQYRRSRSHTDGETHEEPNERQEKIQRGR